MKVGPLLRPGEGGVYSLCLDHGSHARVRYAVQLLICDDPLCECQSVTLECLPDSDGELANVRPLLFTLAVFDRRLHPPDGRSNSPEAKSLGESLVAEMTVADWQELTAKLFTAKAEQTESADRTSLDVAFPQDYIDDPTLMVAYKEVFPWGDVFPFTIGDSRWCCDDQYCVNPRCTCTEAVFTFLRIEMSDDGRPRVAESLPPALYDVRRRKFRPRSIPWRAQPSLTVLIAALREAHRDVDTKLRTRRQELQILYKRVWEKNRPAPLPPMDTPAAMLPNAPCFCGSGKKFKKCHGRVF